MRKASNECSEDPLKQLNLKHISHNGAVSVRQCVIGPTSEVAFRKRRAQRKVYAPLPGIWLMRFRNTNSGTPNHDAPMHFPYLLNRSEFRSAFALC